MRPLCGGDGPPRAGAHACVGRSSCARIETFLLLCVCFPCVMPYCVPVNIFAFKSVCHPPTSPPLMLGLSALLNAAETGVSLVRVRMCKRVSVYL